MRTIGKYEIAEKIGSGGFGEVFKGRDPFIKRHVAIKTCNTGDQQVRDRFFREAEIAGNLHHRNVTTVYDFGIQDGLPYLVQEYLSGEDLDRKIKRRDYLPYPEKVYYLLQIARGLAYAHSKGVIHRDIKPANIRILEDGTAKIMDFGIAKLAQQETSLTQTGMTLGTAAYLAPEQIRGDDVDLRTDIFSFGVLAYELLTYERPFKGKQISVVLHEILNQVPQPLTDKWPDAPGEIVALIDRCLQKPAGLRFADGGELLQALEVIQKQGRSTRQPVIQQGAQPESEATPPPTAPAIQAEDAVKERRAPRPTLEDIEFFLHGDADEKTAHVEPEGETPSRKPSRFPAMVGIAAAAMLAIAGGWWLGARGGDAENVAENATESPPPPMAVTETEDVSDSLGSSDADKTSPADTEVSPPIDDASSNEEAPPPPPPPPPRSGTVVLEAAGWTDQMTVTLGGKSYPLIRSWRLELPPGAHTADFELTLPDYRRRATATVEVTAGQTTKLDSPIPRPGLLTARPLPTKPRGEIWRAGESLGSSPITRVPTEPGRCTIEIRPLGGDGKTVTWQGEILSGQETVISFDLDGGTVRERTKPAA